MINRTQKKGLACLLVMFLMMTMIMPVAIAEHGEYANYEEPVLYEKPASDEAIATYSDQLGLGGYDDTKPTDDEADLVEELTSAIPRVEWTEDFEGNDIGNLRWFQNESIPGNRIGGNIVQSIVRHNVATTAPVTTSPGINSDPSSEFMGRYHINNTAAGQPVRTNRLVFKEPITRAGSVNFTFDWFPGTPSPVAPEGYGSINFNNVYHFNSFNWLRLITTGAAPAGYLTPGVYFYTGVMPNNTHLSDLGLTGDNLIAENRNVWYTVSVYFDFNAKTIDIAFSYAETGTPVWSRADIPMYDEDFLWGQIIALQFVGVRTAAAGAANNMSWNSFIDNVNTRVYGYYLLPFGMPQNVLYTPVTTDSVTLSWDGMDADEFRIYRRHGIDAASRMAVVATVPGDTFTYVDNGLTGPYYWYAVRAVKGDEESSRTKDAFIQLALPDGENYTIISEFRTGTYAGFSNRLRIGDLTGNGRNDILLVNTLTQGPRSWEGFGGANWIPPNNAPGTTTVFTQEDGVWTYGPGAGTVSSAGDGGNATPRVVFSLTAVDIEGNILWQRCAATGMRGFDGFSREVSTAACEPVNIMDVTGDGYNNVILVANPGVLPTATPPPWQPSALSIERGLLDHPDYIWDPAPQNYQNRFYQVANDVFYILCGKTGDIARDVNGREMFMSFAEMQARASSIDPGLTMAMMNGLHDSITLVDLDGRGIPQHVLLSQRYQHLTAWEMINEDGEFVMNFKWRSSVGGMGDHVGHFPLGFPVFANQNDNRDWVIGNQRLHNPATGELLWHAPNPMPSRNPQTTVGGAGSARAPSGHTDSIQIGDFRGDGGLYVQFGVDDMLSGTLFNAQTGSLEWMFDHATELQYQNMGWFRTDADGMFTYGLERRNRGPWPIGHSGTFMIDDRGQVAYISENNYQAWTAIASQMPNSMGTFSPLGLNHNRNIEAILSGNPDAISPENFAPSILVDGYMNVIASIPDISTMSTTRAMVADFIGDSREEIVLYNEFGDIRIVAVGVQDPDINSHVTGSPRPQTRNLGNWTRYNVAEIVTYFSHRTAPSPIVNLVGNRAEITLIPIIFAERYDLYHNGVHIRTFDPLVDDLSFTVSGLTAGEHEFTFTASKFDHFWSRVGTTAPSVPATVSIEFTGTNPNTLRDALADRNVILSTRGNLGIFAHHTPFVIPEGRTLYVATTLNVQGDAELIIEGTVVVLPGGRINNQGSRGGTITIVEGGTLVNDGHVENVTNSTLANYGTIVNNSRFEVRARVTYYDRGDVIGTTALSVHRDAIVIE
ncbi:MAG: fibronectin type III domain-containing protein [Oscillospiraceae bacterium]|nr:fibronectin type III domain-containing protein [Oscillospiraceae bacterium]